MYKRQLEEKQQFIDSLKNRMAEISTNYGVLEYENQTREVTRGYLRTDGGSKVNEDGVEELKANIEKYGPEIIALSQLIESESMAYSQVKLDYEQELRFLNADMTFSNVVSSPFVADKKAYPVRWVVVALCGLAACFITILVVYIMESKKNLVK